MFLSGGSFGVDAALLSNEGLVHPALLYLSQVFELLLTLHLQQLVFVDFEGEVDFEELGLGLENCG